MLQIPFDFVARSERRTEAARQIQHLLTQYPEILDDLRQELAHGTTTGRVRACKKPDADDGNGSGNIAEKVFHKMRSVFQVNGNMWISTPELVAMVGEKPSSVAYVLKRTHKGAFEKKKHESNTRMNVWRMANPQTK